MDCLLTVAIVCGAFSAICFILAKFWDRMPSDPRKLENKSGSEDYIYKEDEVPGVIGGTNLDRFFIECVLSGCQDFTKEKNVAKAQLLAEKYNLSYDTGIAELFAQGMKAHEQISGEIDNDRLSKLREAEKQEYDELNRYADLYGRNKKIAMLTNRMHELRENADALEKGAKMLIRSTQQREGDWATWGGVASGIAGVGAGVATALDIQAQNAQIRAQNEANMRAAIPAYMNVTGSAYKNRENADLIERQIGWMNEKLVSDMSAHEVMGLLEVINATIDVSETGAFKVTATVKPKTKLYIYGDVEAVADGTIIANIYDGTQKIGSAKMVLPVDGVCDAVGVVGMGLDGAKRFKEYTIEFAAHKMWLIEK